MWTSWIMRSLRKRRSCFSSIPVVPVCCPGSWLGFVARCSHTPGRCTSHTSPQRSSKSNCSPLPAFWRRYSTTWSLGFAFIDAACSPDAAPPARHHPRKIGLVGERRLLPLDSGVPQQSNCAVSARLANYFSQAELVKQALLAVTTFGILERHFEKSSLRCDHDATFGESVRGSVPCRAP